MSAPAATIPILLDDQHRYTVAGIEYPSVTTILRLSGLANFSAIPESIRDFVLERGQATHRACHFMLENDLDESSLDPEIQPRVEALKKFLFHSGFKPRPGMIEQRVFHPRYRFCGTYDVIGELPAFNYRLTDCDWKNCDPRMSGTRYQTAAYLLCIEGVYHRAGITLKKDGNFSVDTYSPLTLKQDQGTFLDALSDLRKKGIL